MSRASIKILPWCPFCGQNVGKPRAPGQRKMSEFPLGKCQCGAVYSSDPTGFNVGAAMVETIVHACNDNWDMAWELIPEEDYLTDRIEKYDEMTHQVVETGNLDGRKIKGVLFFVRLHRDFVELTNQLENRKGQAGSPDSASTIPAIEPARDPKRTRKRASKTMAEEMIANHNIDGLVDLVFDDLKTIRFMQRLLYTPDEAFRWKTIDALGKVCARLSTRQPGQVSDLLHRLFAACSDSASTSWGAIETIGAIIGDRPDIFGSFTRHLLNFLGDRFSQAQVLWALGTIAQKRPDLIRSLPFYHLATFLHDPDPVSRGLTLRLLGRIKAKEFENNIETLTTEETPVIIYEEGQPTQTTISELAKDALNLIRVQTETAG